MKNTFIKFHGALINIINICKIIRESDYDCEGRPTFIIRIFYGSNTFSKFQFYEEKERDIELDKLEEMIAYIFKEK